MKDEIVNLMAKRGYVLAEEGRLKYFFVKLTSDYSKNNIICEVYPNANNNIDYFNFVYTNERIYGMLHSGLIKDLKDEFKFAQAEKEFSKLIKVVKKGFNIPPDE